MKAATGFWLSNQKLNNISQSPALILPQSDFSQELSNKNFSRKLKCGKIIYGMTNSINVFTDGGARGNPGPSAIGVYIENSENKKISGFGKTIGIATNNVAEYKAVIEALTWIIENKKDLSKDAKINFFLDSRLVCSQIIGIFKVKNPDLRNLLFDVRQREAQIGFPIYYKHIPRERNAKADSFVNQALDKEAV